jgi:dTDP-4-dehydrorhamnose reductase
MQKNLILGSTGFLGSYFAKDFGQGALEHSRSPRENASNTIIAELEEEKDLVELFKEHDFSCIINCVALADLEKCEKNPELAKWLNQTLPGMLAKHASRNRKKLVHISTDAVFNSSLMYVREDEKKNPQNVYARTKLAGENLVLKEAREAYVFRVNFFGKSPKKNGLLDFFYLNFMSKQISKGFSDVYFTPIYAKDAVHLIRQIIQSNSPGVYHVAGAERLSKYEFGKKIARAMNTSEQLVVPTPYKTASLQVDRTLELSLSTEKIRSLGYTIPSLASGINRAVTELRNE